VGGAVVRDDGAPEALDSAGLPDAARPSGAAGLRGLDLASIDTLAFEEGWPATPLYLGVKPPKVQRKEMHFLDAEQVGLVKTHEARTVRLPRPVAEEVSASPAADRTTGRRWCSPLPWVGR
jgi:hypothetical protein